VAVALRGAAHRIAVARVVASADAGATREGAPRTRRARLALATRAAIVAPAGLNSPYAKPSAPELRVPRPCLDTPVKPCSRLALRCAGAALAAWTATACRPPTPTSAPSPDVAGPVPWATGDVLAVQPISGAGTAARVARLDALLDLLDAARFADDADARERLWAALGGTARGRGPEATRDASSQLLTEAIQLDVATGALDVATGARDPAGLDGDPHGFVSGVIALLSADLGLVGAAEDLSIRTAAYRDVAEHGHPRAADNARWRLYDHVRGCLHGAVSAPQERRVEIALHSLYVREDSLEPWLGDRSVHARPPLPAPGELQALLASTRAAVAVDPRWTGVVARRAAADASLESTVLGALPAARDPAWPVLALPRGIGRRDSLAPIVRVDEREVTIDLGHPAVRVAGQGAPELVPALTAALARDGRGAVLLVAPPLLPSPALAAGMRTLQAARVARIELAVREPRLEPDGGDVILQLPLEVLHDSDTGPAARALRKARLHVHLGGRGVRFAVDGQWLALQGDQAALEAQLDALRRAYPREHMITLGLGDDVLYQQLLDLLRAVVGGGRAFEVAALRPGAAAPPEAVPAKTIAAEERRIERRIDLATAGRASLDQPFPLAAGDQKRLEQLANQLLRCLPELETPLPAGERLRLHLRFEEGRLARIEPEKPARSGARPPATRLAAVQACAADESRGFRLREHRDVVLADVLLGSSR